MEEIVCTHEYENGESAIMLDTSMFFAVTPRVLFGVCMLCGKSFKFVESEPKHFVVEETN